MARVTLEHITRQYGPAAAVQDLSLEVEDKEFVVLLGPSGCGKTTTLNLVAGLDNPTSGHIFIAGQRVDHVPPDRRDIAMVFQSIALYPHMGVFDNIAFPLRMAKVPKEEIANRVRDVANLLRIEQFLDRKPHQLSGGQRQRVALGRAVIRRPAVFLFDEPLSSLDAKLRADMRVEIKKLHERLGATFIYVTHDQIEALTMADRIAVMDKGILLQYGRPREIYERPVTKFVAGFLGSPGMNFVPGRLAGGRGQWRFEGKGFSLSLPPAIGDAALRANQGEVTLGIRPEDVLVVNGERLADTVEGKVFATEPVGSDLFMDVVFDDVSNGTPVLFKVRTRPDLDIRVEQPVRMRLPGEKLYLFDGSGSCIHPRDAHR